MGPMRQAHGRGYLARISQAATATRGGRTFTYRTAEIFHVRNGKVVERWAFSDDTAAIVAFFA